MEAPRTPLTDEVGRLRGCLNDLVSVMALPALWTGGEPSRIVDALLDALLGMLPLAFVFVRLHDPEGGSPVEAVRVAEPLAHATPARDIGKALDEWLGSDPLTWPRGARLFLGRLPLSVASSPMGLNGELGVLVAGSRQVAFPEQSQALLLDVAANQAAIALQQSRLLSAQKRISSELDARVARRARELAAANDELTKEIAERRRVEAALRDSEHESRLIVDSIPGLVALLTATGAVDVVNRQLLEYFGQPLEELRQWGTNGTVHPEDLPHVIDVFTRAIAGGTSYDIVQRLRRADGVYRWIQNSGVPVHDTNGTVVRWCVLLTDIDGRKRAEDAIRRSEAFLIEGQHLARMGNFSWRVPTNDIEWSEPLYRIFEFEPGSTVARIVLNASQTKSATERVLQRYGINRDHLFAKETEAASR